MLHHYARFDEQREGFAEWNTLVFSDSFDSTLEYLMGMERNGRLSPLDAGDPAVLDVPIGYTGEHGYPEAEAESTLDWVQMYAVGLEKLYTLNPSPLDVAPWYERVLRKEYNQFCAALNRAAER